MLRVFPIRSCTPGVYRRAERSGRPCLLGFIGKCAAPCVGDISVDDHRELAGQFADFMAGNTATYTRRIEQQMREAAAAMDRSEEHTSELQSRGHPVCRLLLEQKNVSLQPS